MALLQLLLLQLQLCHPRLVVIVRVRCVRASDGVRVVMLRRLHSG